MPSYVLPSGKDELTGACAFEDGLCAWVDREAYRWAPEAGWTPLSSAPTAIDSGFELQSGIVAGADTHIGYLPAGQTDWAGWVDLSTFSDAHPLYGDLLLCIDASTEAYALFDVTASGLDPISSFDADELADPVAGWSAPTNPERLLLLGEGGLWALSPPYTASDLQHLVSFDDIELPAFEDIPGPFQPGPATVVIPRRTRTGLRLDLSDGSGQATGLAHLPGGTALWTAYLQEERATAARILAVLARLPAPPQGDSLRLHDVWMDDGTVRAVATSSGIHVPSVEGSTSEEPPADLLDTPLDGSVLATWGLWLGDGAALDAACQQLCTASEPDFALVESLRTFAGGRAVRGLFDILRADDPPVHPGAVPPEAVRALVASVGGDVAEEVEATLSAASIPARVAACWAAGAVHADRDPDAAPPDDGPTSALWDDNCPLPKEDLLTNTRHDHPAVRAAARDTCARLAIDEAPSPQAAS